MRIVHYISLVSFVFWLFPLFKQKGTIYFSAFFVLAVFDPLRWIIYKVFGIMPTAYFPYVAIGVLFSLVKKKYKIPVLISGVLIIAAINVFHLSRPTIYLGTSSIHLIIAILLCYKFFNHLVGKHSINLFLFLFFTYEFLTVYKLFEFSSQTRIGGAGFNIGTFFQFFFAIAFTFVNINTKNFSLNSFFKEEPAE